MVRCPNFDRRSCPLSKAHVRKLVWVGLVLIAIAPRTYADSPDRSENPARLSVERIFTEKEFNAVESEKLAWSRSSPGRYWVVEEKKDVREDDSGGVFQVDAASGRRERVIAQRDLIPKDADKPLSVEQFEWSHDESKLLIFTNSRKVWRKNTRGDYWVFDRNERRLTKLGGDAEPSTLMFAKFSPDGKQVAYVCKKHLYVESLAAGGRKKLTPDGPDTLIYGTSDWVNEEELDLRDAFRWSPDSRRIAFWQFDTSEVETFTMIHNTAGTYPETIRFPYPKVGHRNSSTRVGCVPIDGGDIVWFALPGDPREHYIPRMEWSPDGETLLVQQFNRPQTRLSVFRVRARDGAITPNLVEQDETWVENDNPVRWVDQGKGYLWLSERSGWRHLYRVEAKRAELRQLTVGEWDVIDVEAVIEQERTIYFAASPDRPLDRYLYRVSIEGGEAQRVTPPDQPGWHSYQIAADGQWAIHTYSNFMTPPRVELIQLPSHRVVRILESNDKLKERLARLDRPQAAFHRLELEDGVILDAWSLRPPDFDPSKKYPLLFYVYGEPHGQTVRDMWPAQRGLWHWMLAQQGYVVVSVDNRGIMAPRGRAWRKALHRQVGILSSQDQANAAKRILSDWDFVDPSRVGIWGWSGGGSMSLNMIFRYPEIYRVAISVAPVARQELYDSIYQERYMETPQSNAEGFREGSPITHAHRLAGHLLLIHGTGDDNVHYQGTEMLIDELIAHQKDFSMLAYPNRSHSIVEGKGTSTHMYQAMTHYLDRNLKIASPSLNRKANPSNARSESR